LFGLAIEVVLSQMEVPWLRPVTEVGWQNMLVGEVEQADRPGLVVTLEKVVRVIDALIDY
jgi:hypothetical protein